VVTTKLAFQTKNVDSRYIEAMNPEELGSQMDVDPDRARETGQFLSAFCAYSSKAAAVTFEIDASLLGLILWMDHPPACFWKCAFAIVRSPHWQLKRHRKAPRMSSAKRFLRARAVAFIQARTEVV